MRLSRWLLLGWVAWPALGFAQDLDAGTVTAVAAAADAGVSADTFLLTRLEANKPATELAAGLGLSLAQRLSALGLSVQTQDDVTRTVGIERQKELMGCSAEGAACGLELGNALGANHVISGRVDRLGDRYLVNVTVLDLRGAAPSLKTHRDVDGASELPGAIAEIADEIAVHFGVKPPPSPFFSPVSAYGFNLALGLGSELVTSIAKLAPLLNLELGYRLTRSWAAFLQISAGLTFGSQAESTTLIPGLLGARFYFRETKSIQPTLGAGLGVLSTIDSLQGKARPSLVLMGGLWWFIVEPLGVGLEANLDVLGLAFEFADTHKTGVNLSLSLSAMYRF